MSKLISILIPTRNRFDSLLKAVESIVKHTKTPERVEIVMRFDEDDGYSLSRLDELTKEIDINIMVGKRYGYLELHKYVNEMCKETKGEFILWFNDDCVIETKSWDDVVAQYSGKVMCFYPDNRGTGSGNIFPMISRKIYEALGHFSLSQQVDSWQHIVCSQAGLSVKVPSLVFIHNRKQDYVSDKNRAAVLKKTRKMWDDTAELRREDAKKLKKYKGRK
jgi:glycosyltransferase involved in cell wall biosynthesis